MPSDVGHLRLAAVQLFSLATAVMGFGFSNVFIFEFNVSGSFSSALAGIGGFFLGEPIGASLGVVLDWARLGLVWLGFGLYAATTVSVGVVLSRDDPNARNLKNAYLAAAGTTLAVGLLFIASIVDKANQPAIFG